MQKDVLRQWVNLLALVATVVINGLASAVQLNGQTTGEVSARFEVYFVPAGYVFAIWAPIYVGLAAFAVYQALPRHRENPRLRRVGYLFALSCLANIAWLFLWHYEVFALTVAVMVALLLLLIAIYLRLDIGRAQAPAGERWLVHVPFSIYLGWITVATIANVTSVLDYLNWGGWGISAELWTVLVLIAATGIGCAVSLTRGDVAYTLIIAWAFAGIAVKHASTPVVSTAAWVTTGLAGLMSVAGTWLRRARVETGAGQQAGQQLGSP